MAVLEDQRLEWGRMSLAEKETNIYHPSCPQNSLPEQFPARKAGKNATVSGSCYPSQMWRRR